MKKKRRQTTDTEMKEGHHSRSHEYYKDDKGIS